MKNTCIYNSICYLILFAGIAVFTGCGEKLPPGMPRLNPCTITVDMEGQPVENVTVRLVSEDQVHWGCTGITNSF